MKPGDAVYVLYAGEAGFIISEVDGDGYCRVMGANIHMRTHTKYLRPLNVTLQEFAKFAGILFEKVPNNDALIRDMMKNAFLERRNSDE